MKGTKDEVDVETGRSRWTEPSASHAESADQVSPMQRSSRSDRKQRHGWIAAKEKSGVTAQTSIAVPPLLMTDARCSTAGGGVQGVGQRQVGCRLENDCDVARRECGNRDHFH